jgi:D-tyrosyl-tRNA(Tyr) deacylase
VSRAKVVVGSATVGAIDAGLCVLLSVGPEDDEAVALRFAGRIATLRIFPDADGA